MKILMCLALVWLGVAHGKSLPYHSSEELYWGNIFSRGPYRGHSSEEHWWGWNDFGQDGGWVNTNNDLGTAWDSVSNTNVNTNWGTDWMNSNNYAGEGEEPTVDNNNNTPEEQEVSGGQEVVTEVDLPAERDVTTENWLSWNDIGQDGGWGSINNNLGSDWDSVLDTNVNTDWGTDWANSNNDTREGEVPTEPEVSGGQEVVTEASIPTESDDMTEGISVTGYEFGDEGHDPSEVDVVIFDQEAIDQANSISKILDLLRRLDEESVF